MLHPSSPHSLGMPETWIDEMTDRPTTALPSSFLSVGSLPLLLLLVLVEGRPNAAKKCIQNPERSAPFARLGTQERDRATNGRSSSVPPVELRVLFAQRESFQDSAVAAAAAAATGQSFLAAPCRPPPPSSDSAAPPCVRPAAPAASGTLVECGLKTAAEQKVGLRRRTTGRGRKEGRKEGRGRGGGRNQGEWRDLG